MTDQTSNRLEQCLASYGTDVLKMCYVYLSDFALAQDAMQDTFLKVWRKMDTFRGKTAQEEKAWILRIAVNTCKDYHRTAWMRHVKLGCEMESLPQPISPINDSSRALFAAVMALPARLKQAVWLYHYENLNQSECAALLGISRTAFQKRLARAYALLHDQLEGRFSFDETF